MTVDSTTPLLEFPDPKEATEDGLLAIGGNLKPETLILAYEQGIFPWPISAEYPLAWFCPPERAILEWDRIHVSRSLMKEKRKNLFSYSINRDFRQVIAACSEIERPGQDGTWITPQMKKAYIRLHEMGLAHSIEVWEGDSLVGGIYGVNAGTVFSGESMFHLKPNASKLAILFLMEVLHQEGMNWMDIQVMTPHMEAMGARLVSRETFLDRLRKTQAQISRSAFLKTKSV